MADGHTAQKQVDARPKHIWKYPGIDHVAHARTSEFTLQNGLQVDVRLLEKENFGAALLLFHRMKEHTCVRDARKTWDDNEEYQLHAEGRKTRRGKKRKKKYTEKHEDWIVFHRSCGRIRRDSAAEKHDLTKLIELKE